MSHINHEPNLVITPPPATRETQPLHAAPPTARLTPRPWIDRWRPSIESLLIIGAAAGITIVITALVMLFRSAPAATPEPILYVVAAPTPALAVANVARQEQAIVAHHAPEGAIAGVVLVVEGEEIEVIEQYRGWIRFRTPHMEPGTSAWALASDLVGLVDGARLAAAPEIAPTAQPTVAPVVVYVPQPAAAPATRNEPVQLAPVVAPPGAAPTPIGSDLAWYAVPNDGCGGANPPLVCVAAADPAGPGSSEKPNTKP